MSGAGKSARRKLRRVAIVGTGCAGMSAAARLCELGIPVSLVSDGTPGQSDSALDLGGVSAASDVDGDSADRHFADSLSGGDFLARRAPLRTFAANASRLRSGLERLGVPFDRNGDGTLRRSASSGSTLRRTAHAGARTGALVVRALGQQLLRWADAPVVDDRGVEVPGERMIETRSPWTFLGTVRDDNGIAVGIVARDERTMRIRALPADAVCLATGGYGGAFAGYAGRALATGDAAARVFRQGAALANPELVQMTPTSVVAPRKRIAIGDRARAMGGRVGAARGKGDSRRGADIPERERDYFLERHFPDLQNLVHADVATRRLADVLSSRSHAFLELSHLDASALDDALGPTLDVVRKVTGLDGRAVPLAILPAVTGSLGGLFVDHAATPSGLLALDSPRNQATTISGLYAAGEVEYQLHGACALPGNALLGAMFSGWVAASSIDAYRNVLSRSAFDLPSSVFDKAASAEQAAFEKRMALAQANRANENPHELLAELGELLLSECTVRRDAGGLESALSRAREIADRAARARLADASTVANRGAGFLHRLDSAAVLAEAILVAARSRDESRGFHAVQGRARHAQARTTLVVRRDDAVHVVDQIEYGCAGQSVRIDATVDPDGAPPTERTDAESAQA